MQHAFSAHQFAVVLAVLFVKFWILLTIRAFRIRKVWMLYSLPHVRLKQIMKAADTLLFPFLTNILLFISTIRTSVFPLKHALHTRYSCLWSGSGKLEICHVSKTMSCRKSQILKRRAKTVMWAETRKFRSFCKISNQALVRSLRKL